MGRPQKHPIPKIGTRFNRLTVISQPSNVSGYLKVHCRCDCGNERTVAIYDLTSNNTSSCGCYKRDRAGERFSTHGESSTRLYAEWADMKTRCYNSNRHQFKDWGGRGITVCAEWINDYFAFRDWALAHGYRDDLTIDRVNNNLGYSPDNCEWIPFAKQMRNQRTNHLITAFGETKTMSDWAEDPRCKVIYTTLRRRMGFRWNAERAIATPPKHN